MRITNKDIKHLEWVYERMKFVHNENENYDYMIRFREILDALNQTPVSENEPPLNSLNMVKCCDNPDEMWNKHSDIDIGTDTGHYRDLTYNYCNNCGEVWNVEFD